jgi:hypothetical protein
MALQPIKQKKPKLAKGFGATMKPKSVASRVDEITATDSPTMRAARTRAQQQANARGMGNSSIAIGAGELAAIQSALPMASQDSSEANARRLSRMGFEQSLALQDDAQVYGTSEREGAQAFTAGENVLNREFQTSERLGAQEFTFSQNELDRGLTVDEALKEREFRKDERLGAQGFSAAQNQLDRSLTTSERQASEAFRTGERREGQAFSAAEAEKVRDFATNERLEGQAFTATEAGKERAQQLTVIAEQANFDANSEEARREFDAMIAEWNIDAAEKRDAAQYVANASATYANQYSAVLSNPDLSPEARQQQVGLLRAQNEKRLNLGEQIFAVNLDFGTTPTASTPATSTGGGLPQPGEPGYVQGRAPGEQYPGATAAERAANRAADREGRIAARIAANKGTA